MSGDTLRDRLAAVEHERWSHWQRYVQHTVGRREPHTRDLVVPAEYADRWDRQIATPYAELSDREQESDRVEADKTLVVVVDWLRAGRRDDIRKPPPADKAWLETEHRSGADSITPPKGEQV